ncbi:glycosyltransferase family 1 protein [Opitutales bacterium ASA1]|uniref:glycosyltransferase n=1 Tax=Congregicoccus parvus TaxID=3081749 RepID=UPI002B2F2A0A|nr:glycosyltransferase family 1 protein [Opitutales bacterium ASA1]
MKICDIAQFYSPLSGGVKRYLLDKQRFLSGCAGAHHLLIIPSHRDAVTRTQSATIHEVRSPRLIGSRSYRLLVARKRILEIVLAERPDLIEVGDPYRTAWIGLEAGKSLGIPVVAFYHSDFPRAMGRTVRRFAGGWIEDMVSRPIQRYIVRLYNRMDATVVSSSRLCDILGACGIRRIVRTPLGTDIHRFQPQPSRDRVRGELGLAEDARLLLFVGRMAREKNIKNLVAALDRLPADAPPAHLLLVGDGELHEWVVEQVGRRNNLSWMPYCESAQRLADLYSAADLFVHAGRYETFGLVSLEAQACGCPVLAIREGGVEDTLHGEEPRWLANDGTPDALGATIGRFLRVGDSPAARLARRRRIERNFSIDSTFQRMHALYLHLVEHRSLDGFPLEPHHDHGVDLPHTALHGS